ncbi:hypothetical protein Tco_1363521 [Tanacetum coccineum]
MSKAGGEVHLIVFDLCLLDLDFQWDPLQSSLSVICCRRYGVPFVADVAGSFLPNLLNTPPSFRGLGRGEGDLFFLSLLKTLACGDGLREYLPPCLLLGSVRAVGSLGFG